MAKRKPRTYRVKKKQKPQLFDTPKSNIRNITNYLVSQISSMGMSVIVRQSDLSISKSQYLEIDAGKRNYTIRISDHALRHGRKHDFDIYTCTAREKSLFYHDFIKQFRVIAGELPDKQGD